MSRADPTFYVASYRSAGMLALHAAQTSHTVKKEAGDAAGDPQSH